MKHPRRLLIVATLLVIAAPAKLPAGDGAVSPAESDPNWGPTWNIVHTIAAAGFSAADGAIGWHTNWRMYRYNDVYTSFMAPLSLPAGAEIVGLELEACDMASGGQVTAGLLICPHRGGYDCGGSATVETGVTAIPGCDGFFGGIGPYTVDNLVNTYVVVVNTSAGSDYRFLSVLVSYRLQISPAPVDPTFPDVSPSFWAFQEIEALAASGITQGYPDGTFRPTTPVTRAQMATFLARALGLHWAY